MEAKSFHAVCSQGHAEGEGRNFSSAKILDPVRLDCGLACEECFVVRVERCTEIDADNLPEITPNGLTRMTSRFTLAPVVKIIATVGT